MELGKEILWLSENDVSSLLSMKDVIETLEKAFRAQAFKQVQMPAKIYLDFEPFGGDLRTMPAYLKGDLWAAGVKIVNSNSKNPSKGLPAVSGIMVLNDPETGLPLGIFAAGTLTALRTGGAGALAAKFLASPESKTVGLVGCGRQAQTQLEGLATLFNIEWVRVSGKSYDEAQAFSSCFQKGVSFRLMPVKDTKDACDVDILVTTTPSREPLVKNSWVKPGTHINAIGADAPGKEELDPSILFRSRVVVDSWEQASHAGEINQEVSAGRFTRAHVCAELGEIVAGLKQGRLYKEDVTVFDSTGLALQDVAVARRLFEKALALKKGEVLSFYG